MIVSFLADNQKNTISRYSASARTLTDKERQTKNPYSTVYVFTFYVINIVIRIPALRNFLFYFTKFFHGQLFSTFIRSMSYAFHLLEYINLFVTILPLIFCRIPNLFMCNTVHSAWQMIVYNSFAKWMWVEINVEINAIKTDIY